MQHTTNTKPAPASGPLLLIDGHGLAYRAFYGLPDLENSGHEKVGAVYGFLSMLTKAVGEVRPAFMAVALDKEKPEIRMALYEGYKANRQKMPEALGPQLRLIEEMLEIYRIPVLHVSGYEADDCIGTLASKVQKENIRTVILSGDKDFFQLISPCISVLFPKKGISNFTVYDENSFTEEYGFEPARMIDYKALAGDPSDNVPGVAGIGDVTAKKLIKTFGTLENIYENLGKIGGRQEKLLVQSKDNAFLSKELVTIHTNLELPADRESLAVKQPDRSELQKFLTRMEFKTFLERYGMSEYGREQFRRRESVVRADRLPQDGSDREIFMDYTETDAGADTALYLNGTVKTAAPAKEQKDWLEETARFSEEKMLVGFDLKPFFKACYRCGVEPPEKGFDIALGAYLAEPSEGQQTFLKVSEKYLGKSEISDAVDRVCDIRELYPQVVKKLQDNRLTAVFENIEMPLIPVLAKMENTGIYCDRRILEEASAVLERKTEALEAQIQEIAGEKFNINSPKQLGYILFEKLGLPAKKKTATGYSTSHNVLVELIPLSPFISLIIEYKELKKLKTTYADTLPKLIHGETGRIHTTFSSRNTATGRLSSSDPNLQNIPARSEMGQLIRRAFRPREENFRFLSIDYSQIELRLMAHFSGDRIMLDAFRSDMDIHRATAMEIFSAAEEEVTSNMRRKAKEINFGILYGMSSHGLSERLQVPRKEAKEYIDRYFRRFPSIGQYMQEIVEEAEKNGYVTTIGGRKRWIADITSRNANLKSAAERMAVNTVIQGSAADIIKMAMISVDRAIQSGEIPARLLLQIHDELLFELQEEHLKTAEKTAARIMENIIELKIPLKVNIEKGKNWSEMEN